MARKTDMSKLLQKIAKVTQSDPEELAKKAEQGSLYSFEEQVLESQSVINFYRARIARRPPTRKQGESLLSFTSRQVEYEKAANEWRIRTCEGCKLEFAYAFSYEGVKFCSLDCLDSELRKMGLKVTRGRDMVKRWGLLHPAIVPASAYAMLKQREAEIYSESSEETPEPSYTPSVSQHDAGED